MSRISRRGLLGGALGGLASTSVARTAHAQAPEDDAVPPDAPSSPESPEPLTSAATVRTTFFRNGEELTVEVGPHTPALEMLRASGTTGPKLGCGTGSCGSCTVLVDGEPQVTCVMPAVALHRRSITTIEGIARGPGVTQLHPIQRAFLAEDALQCGFCTPGFVVEAAAFHDRWRATHGATEPDRGSIAEALAGHLCKCGAYPAIFRAVAAACRGEHDGQRLDYARVEGPAKVRGEAQFTVDITLEGMLHARVLRSPVAHGTLHGTDDAGARDLPGVRAIHRLVGDGETVRFAGQELLVVAATDEATAARALAAVVLDLQPHPAAIGLEEAASDRSPQVYDRSGARDAPPAGLRRPRSGRWRHNVHGPLSGSQLAKPASARRRISDPEEGSLVVEGQWETQAQALCAMEPHAAVARFGAERLEVWASTQSCQELARELARHFKLKSDQVIVRCPHVGGAFGGKGGLPLEVRMAAELSRLAEAPVRLVLSRDEELLVGGARAQQRIDVGLAQGPEGELAGLSYQSLDHLGTALGLRTSFLARLVYPSARKDLDDFEVVSHTPPASPAVGLGGPAAFFALEGAVDQLAHEGGIDPIGLRRRWSEEPVRHRLLDWAEALDVWTERGPVGQDTGRFRRGVGLAAGAWVHAWDPATQVEIEAGPDGISVRCATQDPGSGTRSLIAEVVARKLGLQRTDVQVEIGDSRRPHGPPSHASLVPSSVVPAAEHAVEQLIDVLVDRAEDRDILGDVAEGGLLAADGRLVPWRELLEGQPPVWTVGRRRRDHKPGLLPLPVGGARLGRVLPAALQVCEVEVDLLLGNVRVRRWWAGIAAGRLATPRLAQSQVEAGVVQGISYALFEERRLDPHSGHLLTHDLEKYRLAGLGDTPEVSVHFETSGFDHIRGGVVGLEDLALVAVPAAVANAVFHATGERPRRLPLTPQQLLERA